MPRGKSKGLDNMGRGGGGKVPTTFSQNTSVLHVEHLLSNHTLIQHPMPQSLEYLTNSPPFLKFIMKPTNIGESFTVRGCSNVYILQMWLHNIFVFIDIFMLKHSQTEL